MTPLEAVRRCTHRDAEWRGEIGRPMRFERAGRPVLAGTDGHMALMFTDPPPADLVDVAAAPDRIASSMAEMLSDAFRPTVEVSLARLRAWAGPGEYTACDRCKGTGKVDCTCDCGDEHTSECLECFEGQRRDFDHFGLILGRKFNRWLVARIIGHATEERVRIGVMPAPGESPRGTDPDVYRCLVLEGTGWRAVVMAARREFDSEELSVFEVEPPAEVRP